MTKENSIFRKDKAIAATSLLISLNGGDCDKYWLNKVMYYIERQSLVKTGQPIFFDELFSAPWGPIVSAVNDGIDSAPYPVDNGWTSHFSLDGHCVELRKEADYSELSEFEERLIEESYKKFEGWDFNRLYKYFHFLPENKETDSRIPILPEEIFEVEGYAKETINEMMAELNYFIELKRTINCA